MKTLYVLALTVLTAVGAFGQSATVYFTNEITPESLVKIYEALGVTQKEGQRVAVNVAPIADMLLLMRA